MRTYVRCQPPSGILLTYGVGFSAMLSARTRPLIAVTLLATALALAACGGGRTRSHRGGASGVPPSIPVVTAAPAHVQPTIQIAGIIAPYQNVSISNSLNEPAAVVNVLQGDHVRKGEVLAVLDTTDLRATYEADLRTAISSDAKAEQAKYQAVYNLGQGTNQVDSALATMRNAKLGYDQNVSLYKNGYVSESQLE